MWPYDASQIVESADLVITCGAVWTDYTTVGYSLLLKKEKVSGSWGSKGVCVWGVNVMFGGAHWNGCVVATFQNLQG